LAADGWTITVGARHEPDRDDFPCVALDRDERGGLRVADGFELLVDVIPFEARHAKQLLEVDVGAIVAISSASVYADEQGRTLDEAQGVDDFPEFPVPIPETQPTVPPGEATYSTKKAAVERILLENDRTPATIVRPCAIYGRGDRMGREWFFVKRAVDRRPYVVLSNRGRGHFHTVAAENVGELVRLVAARPRTDAYNCGDPDPPTVVEIARTIGEESRHPFAEILLAEAAGRGELGQTPWSTPKPLLVDMTKAEEELGYRAATTWADAIPRQVQWLLDATRGRDWREILTRGADYLSFDYDEEDAFMGDLAKA
jgi:nucleoside-diphosphate-sugar epimerase